MNSLVCTLYNIYWKKYIKKSFWLLKNPYKTKRLKTTFAALVWYDVLSLCYYNRVTWWTEYYLSGCPEIELVFSLDRGVIDHRINHKMLWGGGGLPMADIYFVSPLTSPRSCHFGTTCRLHIAVRYLYILYNNYSRQPLKFWNLI